MKWVWHFRDIYTILQQNSSSKIPKVEVEKYEDDSIRKDAMKEVGDLEQILFLEQEKAKILENTTVQKPKKGSIATWYWHWKLNVLTQVQDRWESQIHNLKCVCSYLSRDIRPDQLKHTLLRVPIDEHKRTQAHGALGETSDKSDFSLHAWDSFSQEIHDL